MAGKDKEKAPFYEQRGFQGTVAVVGLLGAIWAFSGAPKPWEAATELAATETVYANTQIILDTSEGMGEPFGDGTRLDAAVKAVEKYVVPLDGEGLALRRTGRSCDEGSDQLVDFGTGHADDVVEEAREQYPEGRSTLAYAVIEAIAEFTASGDFQGPASTRQIVIITGGVGGEECLGSEAGAEIRRRLEGSGIDATFKMVALSPSPSASEHLESFESALGSNAEFDVVETEEELEEVVQQSVAQLSAETGISLEPEETVPGETTDAIETTETTETTEEGGGVGSSVEEGGVVPEIEERYEGEEEGGAGIGPG